MIRLENIKAGNEAILPVLNTHGPVLASLTIYIYSELIEPGKANRPVKIVTRIGKVSRRYRPGEDNQNRAYFGALEEASEIAVNEVLKQQKCNRVFVSQYENAEKAKQDQSSFNYFLR